MRRSGVVAAIVGVVAATAGPASGHRAPQLDRWSGFVAEASRRFEIPQDWIRGVMRLESAGLTSVDGHPITSPAGAMGLMQIMPGTWRYLRDRYGLGPDPYDAHDNILAGAAYLSELYRQFGYPNLFAAYSAGPARAGAFLEGRLSLPEETSNYLSRLTASGAGEALPTASRGSAGLFFQLGRSGEPPATEPPALFVTLRTR